jgi:hypothetical protein
VETHNCNIPSQASIPPHGITAHARGGQLTHVSLFQLSARQLEIQVLLRRSGRAIYLYSTTHKTQLAIIQLEDFLYTSLFPDFLPQPIGGFINNIFRDLNATTKLIINYDVSTVQYFTAPLFVWMLPCMPRYNLKDTQAYCILFLTEKE